MQKIGSQHQTLSERAYENLLDAIVQRDIKPGERLKLEELAATMGISPTPLRQALARLEAEGIVASEPRRGMYVVSLSPKDVFDLCEARIMCESFAVEKIAATITGGQLQKLQQLADRLKEHTDVSEPEERLTLARKDLEFHYYMVELSGNIRIAAWFQTLSYHFLNLALFTYMQRDNRKRIVYHNRIIDGLVAHDGVQARTALVEHLSEARDFILQAMEQGGWAEP